MERTVELDPSHLERFACKPIKAVQELIWNAFDADANAIEVAFVRNDLDGIEQIIVRDDGHGMSFAELDDSFRRLGGSWKRTSGTTRVESRVLHGRDGEGRYRAATQGRLARWESVADVGGVKHLVVADLTNTNLGRHQVDDLGETDRATGTTVTIRDFVEPPKGLDGKDALDAITRHFAKQLTMYPVDLRFDGATIDPKALQLSAVSAELGHVDGQPVSLDIVEWNRDIGRSLFLCDHKGVALHEQKPGIQAPDFFFTAYVKWDGFVGSDVAAVAELDSGSVGEVVELARERMREHFRVRRDERVSAVISRWKDEQIYPFTEEPTGTVEETERRLFDIVAVTAQSAIEGPTRAKRLQLRLIKEALETDPGSLHRILSDVLELKQEQLDDLAHLLDRTTLAAIISVSRAVSDRLEFLHALKDMVFDPAVSGRVKERSQLHRMLAIESWIFGEQWAMLVDDQSLDKVLRRHLDQLDPGRTELAPVRDADGKTRIVDLMLGQTIEQAEERHEHLVIELKAPGVTVGPKEVNQIEAYADAVIHDNQFDVHTTKWDFVVVSTTMHRRIAGRASERNRARGLIYEDGEANVRIWARTWAEIIGGAEHRLKFVKGHLAYSPTSEQSAQLLREKHAKLVPEPMREPSTA